jgi:hypothetical protein
VIASGFTVAAGTPASEAKANWQIRKPPEVDAGREAVCLDALSRPQTEHAYAPIYPLLVLAIMIGRRLMRSVANDHLRSGLCHRPEEDRCL